MYVCAKHNINVLELKVLIQYGPWDYECLAIIFANFLVNFIHVMVFYGKRRRSYCLGLASMAAVI